LNLFQILEILAKHALRAMVIGGHAVCFHGYVRATEDVDVILLPDDGWRENLLSALQELNAYVILDEIDPATGIEKIKPVTFGDLVSRSLIMVGTDFGYLDLFSFAPGCKDANLEDLWRQSISSDGYRFVSLEWLRRLKEASGRPIDQIDLANLPLA